jgi:hypothetical protein
VILEPHSFQIACSPVGDQTQLKGVKIMLKSTLLAAVFGLALIVPASADNQKCDDDTWNSMNTEIMALTDATKKDAAMKEMEEAKKMKDANDLAGCGTHLEAAAKIYK